MVVFLTDAGPINHNQPDRQGETLVGSYGQKEASELEEKQPTGSGRRIRFERLEPAEAIQLLKQQADQGNESAAYMLAISYDAGAGVQPDATNAREWLRRAVTLGPGPTLARAARECSLAASELEDRLSSRANLASLVQQIKQLERMTERLRVVVGFVRAQATDPGASR